MKRTAWLIAAIASLIATSPPVGAGAGSDTPVHARFIVDGPWTVVVEPVTYESGQTGVLYLPVGNDGGDRFPVLVWGNGSGAQPEREYGPVLRSIASHGFVIAASDHEEVGTGEQQSESLDDLRLRAADPSFPLHDEIDLESIGIFGHSQGAGGSTKAASASDTFDAVALLALPARPFAFEPEKQFDTADVTAPTLLLSGTLDIPISPTLINQDHYARLAGPGALAMITDADHLVFQGDGGTGRAYIAAWFAYLLRDDTEAASAFTGDDPEMLRHPSFESQATKNLPAPAPSVTPAVDETVSPPDSPPSDAPTEPASAASVAGATSAPSDATLAATGTTTAIASAIALAALALALRTVRPITGRQRR